MKRTLRQGAEDSILVGGFQRSPKEDGKRGSSNTGNNQNVDRRVGRGELERSLKGRNVS